MTLEISGDRRGQRFIVQIDNQPRFLQCVITATLLEITAAGRTRPGGWLPVQEVRSAAGDPTYARKLVSRLNHQIEIDIIETSRSQFRLLPSIAVEVHPDAITMLEPYIDIEILADLRDSYNLTDVMCRS